jgi:hypothetical protein
MRVDAAAALVDASRPETVRRLVEEILGLMPSGYAALSCKDRLTRDQLAFCVSGQPAVSATDLSTAITQVARHYRAPSWAETNGEQLQAFSMTLCSHLPHLLPRSVIHETMSPVQAVFISVLLGMAKLRDPSYRGDRPTNSRQGNVASHQRNIYLIGSKAKRSGPEGTAEELLSDPSARVIAAVGDLFMDLLGFPR